MEAAKATVLQEIKDNTVMVYSKTYCPFCKGTKQKLNELIGESKYTVHELDTQPDGTAIQAVLADGVLFNKNTLLEEHGLKLKLNDRGKNQTTVPNVWIGGEQIGGDSDVTTALADGSLKAKLEAAGIL